MNINRHNYETFFLLYVDKELSAADRKAVDLFVVENPDLQLELELLQQTVLPADDIVLHKKDWLYMKEDVSALQENLLLYADDELDADNKMAIESLLKTNTTAAAEWAVLQQTKLQPELRIVFEDKQSLYRQERGRVVGFAWWRVAAAAVLLGFGLWAGISVYKNAYATNDGTAVAVKENKTNQAQDKISLEHTSNPTVNNESQALPGQVAVTGGQQNEPGEKLILSSEKINKAVTGTGTADESITQQSNTVKKAGNNLPKPYFENINNKTSNEIITAAVQPENNNTRISGKNDAVVSIDPKEHNAVVAEVIKSNTPAMNAVAVINNTNPGDDNNVHYLDMDNNKTKRTALGGFIRKAKRVLERTTNVKTGEGVKIAGFEIALK